MMNNKIKYLRAVKAGMQAIGLIPVNGANKTYEETEVRSAFIVNANTIGYTFGDDDRPDRIVMSFFASTAAYLSKVKQSKEDEATTLILTDLAGNFKFGAIVEYHNNDESDADNWSFTMTFNEDDIKNLEKTKIVKKHLYSTDMFKSVFDKVTYDVAALEFQHESYMFDACQLVIDSLLQVLDREAKVGEVVDIEFPGYFVASVSVDGDEKVFGIVPDGHLKEIIKDDTALEK